MTGEDEVREEKARRAVLAWVTRTESLLGSAALLKLTSPGGRLHWREAEELQLRCSHLAMEWDRKFPKYAPLLGIAEADGLEVSIAFHALAFVIKLTRPPREVFTSVKVEEVSDRCRAAMLRLSRLKAAERKTWPQMDGRPTAKPISLEVFDKRVKDGETLPTIRAEAKAIAEEVRKRIHKEPFDIKPPAPRTVEDHIRKKFLGR